MIQATPTDVPLRIVKQAAEVIPFTQRRDFNLELERLIVEAERNVIRKRERWTREVPAALREILEAVGAERGLRPEEIVEGPQTKEFVQMRRQFSMQARQKGYSLPQIGRALNRHHTSILHLLKAM